MKRQWRILLMLRRTGSALTAEQMAARFDVHSRTIRRDLDVLRAVSFPIRYERGKPLTFSVGPDERWPSRDKLPAHDI